MKNDGTTEYIIIIIIIVIIPQRNEDDDEEEDGEIVLFILPANTVPNRLNLKTFECNMFPNCRKYYNSPWNRWNVNVCMFVEHVRLHCFVCDISTLIDIQPYKNVCVFCNLRFA